MRNNIIPICMSPKHRILLIAKQGIMCLDLQAQLTKKGYHITYLEKMPSVKDLFTPHVPDIIIVDTKIIQSSEAMAGIMARFAGAFGKLASESVISKSDMLVLNNELMILDSHSIPFDTSVLVDTLENYFHEKEKSIA